MSEGLSIELSPEAVERIAARAAELVLERQGDGASKWLRGAKAIAEHIGAEPGRVYDLAECKPPRIPVHRDGSILVARASELDTWLRNGGGKRP